ncbi:MAG: SsrA-binding protein SmpB [Chloroflexi bacterium]|nr:SsrA-binding protein SmpB [Chloroflexota bacterium]
MFYDYVTGRLPRVCLLEIPFLCCGIIIKVIKTVATNRKAYHNYHIGESVEAGIVLTGSEIKSIRDGRVNLGDAYVRPEGGELWLLNAHIARYESSSYMSHEPTRPRKLLLHRDQIKELAGQIKEKGLTLVPTRMYLKDSLAKVEVALAKGKKLYDKRESIAKRETEREISRLLKKHKA